MFEMKFSLIALVIILIGLGTSMYYSGDEGKALRNNLRAALPEPVEVREAASLPVVLESAAPESVLSETENDVTNNGILAAQPQVEGIITEEAAIDMKTVDGSLVETNDIVAVPLTAKTGTQIGTWIVIGASLLTGSLGLIIFPTAVARG